MEPDAEKRLDRFESKIDQINDKISAFAVVGQRIADLERRVVHIEAEVHELHLEVGNHTSSLAKILAWIGMGGAFAVLVFREVMRYVND